MAISGSSPTTAGGVGTGYHPRATTDNQTCLPGAAAGGCISSPRRPWAIGRGQRGPGAEPEIATAAPRNDSARRTAYRSSLPLAANKQAAVDQRLGVGPAFAGLAGGAGDLGSCRPLRPGYGRPGRSAPTDRCLIAVARPSEGVCVDRARFADVRRHFGGQLLSKPLVLRARPNGLDGLGRDAAEVQPVGRGDHAAGHC